MAWMVELSHVSKRYGGGRPIVAVDDVSIAVEPGAFVVITGPSGSGKTTLLNLIGGLAQPDSGQIKLDGQDLLGLPDHLATRLRARTIGFVFQFQSMLPTLSALDNLRLPFAFAGLAENLDRCRQLLDRFGLADRADAFAHELSAGEQRRVAVARALVNRPRLLLCDEPTSDLDPDAEAAIINAIADARKDGATVILSTHHHALRARGDRALRMEKGRLTHDPAKELTPK